MIVWPPEISPAGQPFRPFGQAELPLSSRRTEYGGGWTGPLTAWLVVFTSKPLMPTAPPKKVGECPSTSTWTAKLFQPSGHDTWMALVGVPGMAVWTAATAAE